MDDGPDWLLALFAFLLGFVVGLVFAAAITWVLVVKLTGS